MLHKSRFVLKALILCAACHAWPDRARAQTNAPAATGEVFSSLDANALGLREARLAVFDEVWQSVRDRYYDPALHGANWDALRTTYRPLAAGAPSSEELYKTLRRMLRQLRDSHTRAFAPEEKFDWHQPLYLSTGLTIREVEGELIVAAVEPESEAGRACVRAGDPVLGVNGEAASVVLRRLLEEEVSASRAATARFQAASMLLDGPRDQQVSVQLRDRRTGRERTIKLSRRARARKPALRLRRAAGDYWIANFNVFTPQIAVEFTRALRRELRGARGLVIDLRQNGGGEAEAMVEIISTLLPPGISLGQFTDRAGRVFLDPRTRRALLFSVEH
ncbi:MAG: S41 family peptidase, partial [Pyrinomonadaceae bacterium]